MIVNIYTDGASSGNPGPSGYGWVLLYDDVYIQQSKSVGVKYSTNNRMELSAVIDSLSTYLSNPELITFEEINIYSDSQYVCNAFNKKWINKWIREDFKKIKNPDLWKELNNILTSVNVPVNFIWIKGHNGDIYNELANDLAQFACGKDGVVINETIKNNKQ